MPSDGFDEQGGGGGVEWSDPSLLLDDQDQKHWFPPNLFFPSAYEVQPQFHPASVGDPAVIHNDALPFTNSHYNHGVDIHQGQHWADLPIQEHVSTSINAASLSGSSNKTTPVALQESLHGLNRPTAEISNSVGVVKPARQKLTAPGALSSPARSVISSTKSIRTGSVSPRQTIRPPREQLPPNHSADEVMSLGPGQKPSGNIDGWKHPTGPKGTPLARMVSVNTSERQREEDSRSQADLNTSGGSVVSSASAQSRTECLYSRSDHLDDTFASGMPRKTENKEAGKTSEVIRLRQGEEPMDGQYALPNAKGFSIQIGSEVFKLSGASIMSDGQHGPFTHRSLVGGHY